MLMVDDVHFHYRDSEVLAGLSIHVGEGEMVGIVGPNGAGKTTLLRLISGVIRPAQGRIRINGSDLAALKPRDRARLVSVVPQNPQLPLGFPLIDLVLMGRNPHLNLMEWEGPGDLEIARGVMEMTDTLHLSDRTLGTLSGGERQRGLVAMALAQQAPVLLLDEPTSNLDLAHQTGIMDLIASVQQRRGGAVVVAMHDLTLAAQYCHRIVLLAEGRSFAEGAPEAVLTPENISRLYNVQVNIMPHPQGGMPVVLPLSSRRPVGKP